MDETGTETEKDQNQQETQMDIEFENLKIKKKTKSETLKRKHHKQKRIDLMEFKHYILKIAKNLNPDIGINDESKIILNSLLNEILKKIYNESCRLSRYNNKKTISTNEIKCAVKLVLNDEIAIHCIRNGDLALSKFISFEKADEI